MNPWVPVAISVGAAIVAVVALWRTHFQRFRLVAVVGELSMSVYPIRNGDERWYILSPEVPMTLSNAGARPGSVLGLRLNLRFPDVGARFQRLPLWARFVIVNDDDSLRERGRFDWLSAAATLWRPRLLLPKESITERVVFERRIEEPIVGRMQFRLEAYTKRPRGFGWLPWSRLAVWDFDMSPSVFSELTLRVAGGGFMTSQRGVPNEDDRTRPSDLLARVRFPAEELPPDPFSEPSYLDYPADQ